MDGLFQSSTHQIETEEVEDLPGVVLLQDLLQRVFDEAGQRLGRVLQGVAHEVVQRGPFRRVAHQGSLLTFPRRGRQDAGGYKDEGAESGDIWRIFNETDHIMSLLVNVT